MAAVTEAADVDAAEGTSTAVLSASAPVDTPDDDRRDWERDRNPAMPRESAVCPAADEREVRDGGSNGMEVDRCWLPPKPVREEGAAGSVVA